MSGVFKEVRAFFNWAYKTKLIDAFPFEGFEMPSERYGSPIYLTLDDVQRIYNADLSSCPHLAAQRDFFVFQCNVGCRIGDLLRLKKCDVINGAIEYIPTKTIKENACTVVVPLNTIAKRSSIDMQKCQGNNSCHLRVQSDTMTISNFFSKKQG